MMLFHGNLGGLRNRTSCSGHRDLFSRTGQSVILFLIQLGGLGIMTYASLVIYLLGKKSVPRTG